MTAACWITIDRRLQHLARERCSRDNDRWPVEMLFTRWLVPAQQLS